MSILLLGKDGQVGWQLQRSLAPHGEVIACGRSECDLTELDGLRSLVRRLKPSVIVNAAAYTAVDRAESEPELAMRINSEVPGALAEEAAVLGALLMAAGVLLMTAAQLQMGRSWRIGIEEDARPGLVTWGLYRYCRNPIFAAMLVTLGGLALLMPSLLTLLILVITYAGIRRQVADEESYLRRSYDDAYLAYAARVGRFTPWLGRLA